MNKRNALLIALVASVALNLLIAGMFFGRWSRPHPPPPLSWAVQPLPAEARTALRRQLAARQAQAAPLREDLRAAMQAVRHAAGAEPLDREALAGALAAARDAQRAYQAFLHENLLEIAAMLPREQRLALLRRAMDVRGRGDKRPPPRAPQR